MTSASVDGLAIVPAGSDQDVDRLAAIWAETQPDCARSPAELRHDRTLSPRGQTFLTWLDGQVVGGAVASTFHARPPDFEGAWTTLMVRDGFRRRGIGSVLLETIATHARTLGKAALYMEASEARPEGIDFLRHRGFAEWERSKHVALQLAGVARPDADPPAGVRIVTLAERPDLAPDLHGVAVEAMPDVPGGGSVDALPYEDWRRHTIDLPGAPSQASFAALVGDDVVGWAYLDLSDARPGTGYHAMTAVLRAWRGRGIASALKRATIAWAIDRGLVVLEADNDQANSAMRAVNDRLGYRPLPDRIVMRGPLSPGA